MSTSSKTRLRTSSRNTPSSFSIQSSFSFQRKSARQFLLMKRKKSQLSLTKPLRKMMLKLRMKVKLNQLRRPQLSQRQRLSQNRSGNGKPSMKSKPSGSVKSQKLLRRSTSTSTRLSLRITKILSLTLISQLKVKLNSKQFFSFPPMPLTIFSRTTTVNPQHSSFTSVVF